MWRREPASHGRKAASGRTVFEVGLHVVVVVEVVEAEAYELLPGVGGGDDNLLTQNRREFLLASRKPSGLLKTGKRILVTTI